MKPKQTYWRMVKDICKKYGFSFKEWEKEYLKENGTLYHD